ncbi:MarR family winged helix-turn-helix transcriptional regulator [uncultured Intestinimonas sp.]|uniref:MarR family winged helix-turn-helix transcriptional regulator n=1 Tax=uncultured Intestinimonas sp. TaxID=1689265 RepID=UPI0025F4D172|nr:winged helix-turn-helix transcriptional regulator [uncultured Intestinimonas sp.]
MPHDREKATSLDALNEAFMELDHAYDKLAKSCGLSEPEYWSLVLIRHGVETQREISERLALSPQTVNSAFKLLLKKGLVRLEPYTHDQRSKRAVLTEDGRAFVAEHIVRLEMVEARAWDTLSAEEQSALIYLLRRFSCAMTELLTASSKIS